MTALQILQYPVGEEGVTVVSPLAADYTCQAPGASGTTLSAAGCAVNIAHSTSSDPTVETVNVTISLGSVSQSLSVYVFHPFLSLSAAANELRLLTGAGCNPPAYESTTLLAEATFVHPDDASQLLTVDITDQADLEVDPPGTLRLLPGAVTALAPVTDATITLAAASPGGAASVTLSVLDEPVCIDALVPVVVSAAALQVSAASASNITVQLAVQQNFTDPGDVGAVAVYAQKGLNYMDVTDKVCPLTACTKLLTLPMAV